MASSKKSASNELLSGLATSLSPYLQAGRRIVVALSGGVDSVVLLDLLDRLRGEHKFELAAVHVNHQISDSAQDWEGFCIRLCEARGIPLTVRRVRVPRRSKLGLEGAARIARYSVFADIAADCLVLAHHLDDQTETILLNLLRGTGVRGAAGMSGVRTQAPVIGVARVLYARPFLDVTRAALLSYAGDRGLLWVEDDSNTDTTFARNFLRREIMPQIEQRFPAYRQSLARAARHFSEAAQLLDALAEIDLQAAQHGDKLRVAPLAELPRARAKNLLRGYLTTQGVPMPDTDRLEEWLRQLITAGDDRVIKLELGDLVLRRYRGEVWVERDLPPLPENWAALWRGEAELDLKELGGVLRFENHTGIGISRERLQHAPVAIRARQGGEKIRLDTARPRQTIKNLLQDAAIPPWRRGFLPMLFCGEDLVAVPGIGIDADYQVSPGEPGICLNWVLAGAEASDS